MIKSQNSAGFVKSCIRGLRLLALLFIIASCSESSKSQSNVKIVGAIKDVMHKGEIQGKINLDTLSDKKNIYGLGPMAYLYGEVMVIDGKSYKSYISDDSLPVVEETFKVEAPFFAYSQIANWIEITVPDSNINLKEIESILNNWAAKIEEPFLFRMQGIVQEAIYHIVNLPKGKKIASANDAHEGQMNFSIKNQEVEIIGFYSQNHKGVFTHHDTNIHLHIITKDRQQMGHLDDVEFISGMMKLFVPFSK